MPKFLDAPQWYNAAGSTSHGLGSTTNPTLWSEGTIPYVSSNGIFLPKFIYVNGSSMGNPNIYAPNQSGSANSVCYWDADNVRPMWLAPSTSNPSALVYNVGSNSLEWEMDSTGGSTGYSFTCLTSEMGSCSWKRLGFEFEEYTIPSAAENLVTATTTQVSLATSKYFVQAVLKAGSTVICIAPFISSVSVSSSITYSQLLTALSTTGVDGYHMASGFYNQSIITYFRSSGGTGYLGLVSFSKNA